MPIGCIVFVKHEAQLSLDHAPLMPIDNKIRVVLHGLLYTQVD